MKRLLAYITVILVLATSFAGFIECRNGGGPPGGQTSSGKAPIKSTKTSAKKGTKRAKKTGAKKGIKRAKTGAKKETKRVKKTGAKKGTKRAKTGAKKGIKKSIKSKQMQKQRKEVYKPGMMEPKKAAPPDGKGGDKNGDEDQRDRDDWRGQPGDRDDWRGRPAEVIRPAPEVIIVDRGSDLEAPLAAATLGLTTGALIGAAAADKDDTIIVQQPAPTEVSEPDQAEDLAQVQQDIKKLTRVVQALAAQTQQLAAAISKPPEEEEPIPASGEQGRTIPGPGITPKTTTGKPG